MNGQLGNLRIAPAGSTNGQKADPNDPQARKLVYNAYRDMLSKKHAASTVIVDSAPQELVTKDEGVGARVESMMRQKSELKSGNMYAGGPPPPPPPPPIPGVIPSSRLPSEIPTNMNQPPPSVLASAMMKDRKPFTYTPGGLDLSEISNQPNQNGNGVDDFGVPTQSRSFRVLQNVLDHHDTADSPTSGAPMKIEVPLGAPAPYYAQHNGSSRGSFSQQSGPRGSIAQSPGEKRGSFSQQNEKRGSFSQAFGEKRGSLSQLGAGSPRGSISYMSNDKRGSLSLQGDTKKGSFSNSSENQGLFSRINGQRGSVGNIVNAYNQENRNGVTSETDGLKIIQHSVGGVSKIILGQNGGSEPTSPDTKELSNIFKNQVRISANTDETRTRGGHFTTKDLGSGKKIEPQGPIHIPTIRQHVQQPSHYQQLQPNQCQPQPVYQQHSGVNNAASVEQSAPEPKKYMGGNIPSRSFRMLQAMTGSDDVAGPGQSDL